MPLEKFSFSRLIQINKWGRFFLKVLILNGIWGGTAHALSLGNMVVQGYIGTPLRLEIPIENRNSDKLGTTCIHLIRPTRPSVEDLPWLGHASTSIEFRGNQQFLVLKTRSVQQPALKIGLEIECGFNLRRDYTILLDPSPVTPLPATIKQEQQEKPTFIPSRHTRTSPVPHLIGPAAWQIQPGDSAQNIAARLAPGQRHEQKRLADEILKLNQAQLENTTTRNAPLPVGLRIHLPPLPDQTRQSAQRTQRISNVTEPRPHRTRHSSSVQIHSSVQLPSISQLHTEKSNHLIVTGGPELPLQLSRTLSNGATTTNPLSEELKEQQLLAALDEKTATQIELKERLRQLEALQQKLQEQTAHIENRLHQLTPPPSQASAPLKIAKIPLATPAPTITSHTWTWWQILIIATGGILILIAGVGTYVLFRRRTPPIEPLDGDTLPVPVGPSEFDAEIEKRAVPLSEADIWPDHAGRAPTPEELAKTLSSSSAAATSQFTVTGLGSTSQLHVVEHDIDEHESAIELADIMLSFGRVQGAAQTLADYIRNHPTRAVRPWIKLLEVYQAADMKTEFNALAQQINKHFNVKQVNWEQFNAVRQGPDSLEHLPHIAAKLQETWGTRDCQSYLYRLLHDNRNGTRQGFSIAIVDEIMILLGIMEQTVGSFRPSTESNYAAPTLMVSTTLPPPIPPTQPVVTTTDPAKFIPPVPETNINRSKPSPQSSKQEKHELQTLDFELDLEDFSQTLNLDTDKLHKE